MFVEPDEGTHVRYHRFLVRNNPNPCTDHTLTSLIVTDAAPLPLTRRRLGTKGLQMRLLKIIVM
jgi:hypothetical protein